MVGQKTTILDAGTKYTRCECASEQIQSISSHASWVCQIMSIYVKGCQHAGVGLCGVEADKEDRAGGTGLGVSTNKYDKTP